MAEHMSWHCICGAGDDAEFHSLICVASNTPDDVWYSDYPPRECDHDNGECHDVKHQRSFEGRCDVCGGRNGEHAEGCSELAAIRAYDPPPAEFQTSWDTATRDLLLRHAKAVDEKLRDLLRARGIDPDDRSDGWESRARAALADVELVDATDMSDPYRMTVTTEIRPRRP